MAHPNLDIKEKLVDLPGTTLSIWKVHPDVLREQDRNARVMDTKTFQRLTENIKGNKQLESLPYCHKTVSPGGSDEFSIISGHHRIRAARKAGLTEVFVLVDDKEMTRAQVTAKQLAHNALSGTDDEQVLAELFASIDDVNAKLEAGIFNLNLQVKDFDVKADDLKFDFAYEQMVILFLRPEYQDFNALLAELDDELKNSTAIGICAYDQFDGYRDIIRDVSKCFNVRNIAAVMARIVAIVREDLDRRKAAAPPSEEAAKGKKPASKPVPQKGEGNGLL
jgi:hypothetical protein